jgi:hypothetical protein
MKLEYQCPGWDTDFSRSTNNAGQKSVHANSFWDRDTDRDIFSP